MRTPALFALVIAGGFASANPPSGGSPFARLPQEPPASDAGKEIIRPKEESIISQSTILHDGESWTLVPKGAVLHTPLAMKDRVGAKPVGSLLPWTEFLTKNRAWLSTQEVDLAQAAGRSPLPADRAEVWFKLNKVVVAVHFAGPISVRTEQPQTAAHP